MRAPDAADWPVETGLEELLEDPRRAEELGSTLSRHLGADLPADHILVAGVIAEIHRRMIRPRTTS